MCEAGMTPGKELAGKVALVTGGARNIGRAIARSLAAGGASVMVNANTSRDAAQETVAMITGAGGQAAYFMGDVTDVESVRAMMQETIRSFGRLDILVNNALNSFVPSASYPRPAKAARRPRSIRRPRA